MKAECPLDRDAIEKMIPVLQDEVIPHAAADQGFRQIFFFVDHSSQPGQGNVFSITIYDSEADLDAAMREQDGEYRFTTLARLDCTAVDARRFEVIAGAVNPEAPAVEFG